MSLVHVGYRVRDADGDTSTFGVKLPLGILTMAELIGFAEQFAAKVDAVIDGVIDSITVSVSVALPGGLATVPEDYCEVQKGALFSFACADTAYRHSLRVPAFCEAKFSGNEVNTGDAQVIAFRAGLITGESVGGTMVEPCDKYENDLESLIEAVKSFRRK